MRSGDHLYLEPRPLCPCGSGLPVYEGKCPLCYFHTLRLLTKGDIDRDGVRAHIRAALRLAGVKP